MSQLTRRSLLIGGATVAAVALTPEIAHANPTPTPGTVHFTLNAVTLDGGEQVTSLTLDTNGLTIDPASLTTGTFLVHATAVSPVALPAGQIDTGAYDTDRVVTAVHLVHDKIVVELKSGFSNPSEGVTTGEPGAGTLTYIYPLGRNLRSKLTYTITQKESIKLRKGGSVTFAGFAQGKLVNPEVDAYKYAKSGDGMNYRLYVPAGHGHDKKPLVVWLHGGGEGGAADLKYYDNEAQLRANRGALGFSTPQHQDIFNGAYVVAPQAESFWLENGDAYSPRVLAIIEDLVRRYPIDVSRIYLAGCSNGGYLTMKMSALYHDVFAAAVPICGVVKGFPTAADVSLTDAELKSIVTPSWLVCAASDTTVPPVDNSVPAHALIKGSILTEDPTVLWQGVTYPGHWSWIYVARNDPKNAQGQHVMQWMASKKLWGHRR